LTSLAAISRIWIASVGFAMLESGVPAKRITHEENTRKRQFERPAANHRPDRGVRRLAPILSMDDQSVRVFLLSNVGSDKVKAALEQIIKLRADLAHTQHEIGKEEQALQGIEKDQERMRANMARVPQTSEAYKRYLKKFDDQPRKSALGGRQDDKDSG